MHIIRIVACAAAAVVAFGAFASEPYRGLPSDYTQLEYIRSTKAQSINSLVVAKTSLRVELDFISHSCEGNILGMMLGNDSKDWRLFNHSLGVMFDCGTVRLGQNTAPTLDFNTRYRAQFGEEDSLAYLKIDRHDGTPHCSLTTNKSSNQTDQGYFAIFAGCGVAAPGFNLGNYSSTTMYSLKVADGDEPLRDYVPAKNEHGILGLYDFVSESFFTNLVNNGANTFVAGPEVHGMVVEPILFYDTSDGIMKLRARVDRNDDRGDLYVVIADASRTNEVKFAEAAQPHPVAYEYAFSELPAGALVSVTMKTVCDGYIIEYPLGSVFNGGVSVRKGVDADGAESQAGTFVVSLDDDVVASSDLEIAYEIDYSASSAIAGQHYVPISGVVTIPAGANSANIKVFPVYDATATDPKTLAIKLLEGSYFLGDSAAASLSILNGNVSGFWQFDSSAGTLSDGIWRFACSANGQNLTVGAPQGYPDAISPLDFSKPIVNSATGEPYVIDSLNGMFNANGTAALKVGELTLPGESVTFIGGGAFRDCKNATGSIVLPSRLTALNGAIFFHCSNLSIDLNQMPTGITSVSPQVFGGCSGAFGDVDFPNVTAFDGRETFSGTAITSIRFGAKIGTSSYQYFLGQPGGQGCFVSCKSLTNVVISASQDIDLAVYNTSRTAYPSAFDGCTALEELDFSGLTKWGGRFSFSNCPKLKRIILGGTEMESLAFDAFNNLPSAFSEVVFKSAPPITLDTPYLNTISHAVTTTVSRANYRTLNSSGRSWLDYAANGEIHSVGSTIAAEYVGVDPSLRPLVAPDLVVRGEATVAQDGGDWVTTVKVTSGEGALYVLAVDSAQRAVTNLVAESAEPSDTPYGCTLDGLDSGCAYSLALLSCVDGVWEASAPFASIFTGGVTITKARDAEVAFARSGAFRVALENEIVAGTDITVLYAVDPSSTAVVRRDYAELSGSVVIPAGSSSAEILVPPLVGMGATDDTELTLVLSSGNYTVMEPSRATIAIKQGSFDGWRCNEGNQTVTDGTWTFAVTVSGTEATIGTVVAESAPAEVSPLDFSRPIVDGSGIVCTIVGLNPYFNGTAAAKMIGELTMPGEGLKTLGNYAFYGASNATGEILLPSTLETVGGFSFASCTKLTIDAAKLPSGINRIDACAFQSCKGMTGDVYLPSIEHMDARSTFAGSGITSFRCGSGLKGNNGVLSGGWNQGCFQGCTALTNVDFSAVQNRLVINAGAFFAGCTSLGDVDLTGIAGLGAFYVSGYFQDCRKVGKITFGATFDSLDATAFDYCSTTITNLVFKGPLPSVFGISYLTNVTQKVTTTILRKNRKVKNANGRCWLDLADDNRINHRGTTFAAEFVTPEIDLALRPLVTLESNGVMMIIR